MRCHGNDQHCHGNDQHFCSVLARLSSQPGLPVGTLFHYENISMQYTDIFKVVKNERFQ